MKHFTHEQLAEIRSRFTELQKLGAQKTLEVVVNLSMHSHTSINEDFDNVTISIYERGGGDSVFFKTVPGASDTHYELEEEYYREHFYQWVGAQAAFDAASEFINNYQA